MQSFSRGYFLVFTFSCLCLIPSLGVNVDMWAPISVACLWNSVYLFCSSCFSQAEARKGSDTLHGDNKITVLIFFQCPIAVCRALLLTLVLWRHLHIVMCEKSSMCSQKISDDVDGKKQYLLNSVLNTVKSWLCSSDRLVQYPLLILSVAKNWQFLKLWWKSSQDECNTPGRSGILVLVSRVRHISKEWLLTHCVVSGQSLMIPLMHPWLHLSRDLGLSCTTHRASVHQTSWCLYLA